MKATLRALAPILCLLAAPASWAQGRTEKLLKSFLPRGASLSQFVRADPATGKVISSSPAFVTGHIVSPKSEDVVFAYESGAPDLRVKSMFVALLHHTRSGYAKVFELTYYGRYLWAQDFHTIGLQLVPLPGTGRSGIVVITAVGASLGARVEVFRWDDTVGLENVFAKNSEAHSVRIWEQRGAPVFELGFGKYSGEAGAPPPLVVRWNGRAFVGAR